MAITIFGRGIPLSAVDDGSTLQVHYGGAAIMDITSAGLSGLVSQANSTTITATSITGTNIFGTGVSGTTISGTSIYSPKVYATTLTGQVAVSAGYTSLAFIIAGAGKHMSAYGVEGFAGSVSADALMCANYGAVAYYIPCFSAFAKEA